MPAIKILPNIYSVGVVDWKIRSFHGHTYSTNRGSTYNSYLIIDDKITLIDTVLGSFSEELINNIREVVPVDKIDYIIANHVETDHSGALPEIMKLCPRAKVFGTKNCKEGLYRYYYGNWDFQIVKTGDKLNLGKKSLNFIEAPMIHWPDSMFTYCPEEQVLFPNDAFGQHYATSERFDDETDPCALMDEVSKYFANILWPLGTVILRKIEDIQKMGLPIKIIAPSHGVVWRGDPMKPIKAYISWCKNETKPKAVIVYETMWGATEKMARKIAEGITASGAEAKIFDVATSDRSEVINAMLDAKGFVFGSSTHDNDMLPNFAGFLEFLKGLRPKDRVSAVFGSYGWAGGAIKEIEEVLKEAGLGISQPSLGIKYMPSDADLKTCFEFGRDLADKIK